MPISRLMKTLVLGLLLFALLPSGIAAAFPGSEADERCEALYQQAIDAAAANGTRAEAPDCAANIGLSAMETRAAEREMLYSPTLNISTVEPIEEVVFRRKFVRLYEGATIYDAPNGNPIRTVGGGLTIVSFLGKIEGWVQLRQHEWVPINDTRDYQISEFAGVEVTGHLERPFAWILVPAKPSLYPGGPQHEAYEELARYQIVNIYGIEIVNGWQWYLIGQDQWVEQIRVAKIKSAARPEGVSEADYWIAIDLYEQTAVAYEGDRMVYATLISSGLPQWSTQEGLFQIYQRWVYGPMSGADGRLGDAYYIENIANIMYFDGDIALHAAYWHDNFGYRQSRGCVNLSLMDAFWLYEWSRAQEDAFVYVYSSGRYRSDLPDWAIRRF